MNTRLLNSQPWRFEPGDTVFVRGWPLDESGRIVDRALGGVFPHYHVVDGGGLEWCIAQIELSSKPILTR